MGVSEANYGSVIFEKKGEKQFKKKKSVNWESKILENKENTTKEEEKKPEVKLSSDNDKEYLDIFFLGT